MARWCFDFAHRFVETFVYELPHGKGRTWAASGIKSQVLGGWEIMYSQTLQAGPQRQNQILPNNQAVVQDWTSGPNRLPATATYLNPAALAAGTMGRNRVAGQGIIGAPVSLSKTWVVKERPD